MTQNPIRLLVSISNQNLTHDIIKNTGKLTVSVLTEKTPFSVYSHFGYQSGKTVDKFDMYTKERLCRRITFVRFVSMELPISKSYN